MASVSGSPSPPGTLRWMEYPSSPSRARQILQIHKAAEGSAPSGSAAGGSRQSAARQSLAPGTLGSVTAGGSAAGDVVAGGVTGDGRSEAGGVLADGQSAASGSARNQRMFGEGLRGERQNGGQWHDSCWRRGHLAPSTTTQGIPLQEALARERL